MQSEGRTEPSHSTRDPVGTQQRPCRVSRTGHRGLLCTAGTGTVPGRALARCHPCTLQGGQSSREIYDSEKSWLGWFFSRYYLTCCYFSVALISLQIPCSWLCWRSTEAVHCHRRGSPLCPGWLKWHYIPIPNLHPSKARLLRQANSLSETSGPAAGGGLVAAL